MNTCPVYRRSGGYAYTYFIPGPIGINLGMLRSPPKYHDNVSACSLCSSCSEVCPVKVDLAQQIYRWRQELDTLHLADPGKKRMVNAMKTVRDNRYPVLYCGQGGDISQLYAAFATLQPI